MIPIRSPMLSHVWSGGKKGGVEDTGFFDGVIVLLSHEGIRVPNDCDADRLTCNPAYEFAKRKKENNKKHDTAVKWHFFLNAQPINSKLLMFPHVSVYSPPCILSIIVSYVPFPTLHLFVLEFRAKKKTENTRIVTARVILSLGELLGWSGGFPVFSLPFPFLETHAEPTKFTPCVGKERRLGCINIKSVSFRKCSTDCCYEGAASIQRGGTIDIRNAGALVSSCRRFCDDRANIAIIVLILASNNTHSQEDTHKHTHTHTYTYIYLHYTCLCRCASFGVYAPTLKSMYHIRCDCYHRASTRC